MPHKDKEQGRIWRRKWWASLPIKRKREKQIKANQRSFKIKEFLANFKIKKEFKSKLYHSRIKDRKWKEG